MNKPATLIITYKDGTQAQLLISPQTTDRILNSIRQNYFITFELLPVRTERGIEYHHAAINTSEIKCIDIIAQEDDNDS